MIKKYIEMLDKSPTSFNATKTIVERLEKQGYKRLVRNEKVKANSKYYATKNNSSIIAFNIPEDINDLAFNIVASHLDCPSFKLKPDTLIKDGKYVRLNLEAYGGVIMSTWLDRPLSLAGRVMVKTEQGLLKTEIIKIDETILIIPNVAIHMNRDVNNGYKFNVKNDMRPIISLNQDFNFEQMIKNKCSLNGEVISYDLFLYPTIKAENWGCNKEFISSFHIDNLGCAFSSLEAFLDATKGKNINIYASFDNEEIGSLTQQGADSNFFYDLLTKICKDLDIEYFSTLENSFLISADNAHAHHPNHPEYSDENNKTLLNGGVVIKYNANQSYTSDAYSIAIFKEICERANVSVQYYTNRADLRGGSTLGNLSNAHVSLSSVDIGLPQLAMHSCFETSGKDDYIFMVEALKEFYNSKICVDKELVEIK